MATTYIQEKLHTSRTLLIFTKSTQIEILPKILDVSKTRSNNYRLDNRLNCTRIVSFPDQEKLLEK